MILFWDTPFEYGMERVGLRHGHIQSRTAFHFKKLSVDVLAGYHRVARHPDFIQKCPLRDPPCTVAVALGPLEIPYSTRAHNNSW